MLREAILSHAEKVWGIRPDYPWAGSPDSAVLRHPATRKWFGLMMRVNRRSLGLTGDGSVDVINVKCDPLMLPSLLKKPGHLPAYHMNKSNWLTILLDGSVSRADVFFLLEVSYHIIRPGKKQLSRKVTKECLE